MWFTIERDKYSNKDTDFHAAITSSHINNKFMAIDIYSRKLPGFGVGDIFRLLAKCFPLFCSDLAVLIFMTLLADIQKPI